MLFFSKPSVNQTMNMHYFLTIEGSVSEVTLLLQKPRALQIQGVQGRSRSILLRVLGNEGGGASSAFPPGKKHDEFFICFRNHQKFIRKPCLNVFKCPVIILFFYSLSSFL